MNSNVYRWAARVNSWAETGLKNFKMFLLIFRPKFLNDYLSPQNSGPE